MYPCDRIEDHRQFLATEIRELPRRNSVSYTGIVGCSRGPGYSALPRETSETVAREPPPTAAATRSCIRNRISSRNVPYLRGEKLRWSSILSARYIPALARLSKTARIDVTFGQASGPIDPCARAAVAEGSLFLTRPFLFHYIEHAMRSKLARTSCSVVTSEKVRSTSISALRSRMLGRPQGTGSARNLGSTILTI